MQIVGIMKKNIAFVTLNTLIDIMLFRKTPAQLPYSYSVLFLILMLDLGLTAFNLSFFKDATLKEEILVSGASLAIYLGLLYSLLTFRGVQPRFHKTALAILGCEVLLFFPSRFNVLISIPITIWQFCIEGHILKNSLDIKMAKGILIALGLQIISALPILFVFYGRIPVQPS